MLLSTTAGVPGGAMPGALGGIVRHHSTRHFKVVVSGYWEGKKKKKKREREKEIRTNDVRVSFEVL